MGLRLRQQWQALSWIDARRLLWAYRKFSLLGVPSSLANALAVALPLPLLAAFYGLDAAGQFSLVQRVLWLPIAIVGAAAADALHGRLAHYAREAPHRALPLFDRTGVGLLLLGILPAAAVASIGPPLFEVVFGHEWRMAGELARSMTPSFLAAIVVSPLSRVVIVYHRQELKLVYDLVSVVLVPTALIVAVQMDLSVDMAVLTLSGAQVVAYSLYLVILRRIVRQAARRDPVQHLAAKESDVR